MAKGTLDFFAPTNPFAAFEGWTFQDGGAINGSSDRHNELGSSGDEIKKALVNGKETTSATFIGNLTATTAKYKFPKIGSHSNGWHIDSIQVVWDRGAIQPKMTVNAHKHTQGTMHTTCRQYTPSLSEKVAYQAFGAPSAVDTAFALATQAVVDVRTITYNVSCTHVDEPGRTGNNLAGNNYDGVETLQIELTGAATTEDYTTTWDKTGYGKTPSNTAATSSSLTLEHHISADAAA